MVLSSPNILQMKCDRWNGFRFRFRLRFRFGLVLFTDHLSVYHTVQLTIHLIVLAARLSINWTLHRGLLPLQQHYLAQFASVLLAVRLFNCLSFSLLNNLNMIPFQRMKNLQFSFILRFSSFMILEQAKTLQWRPFG